MEVCSLRDELSAISKHDVVVYGISSDLTADNLNFAQRQGLNFVLLSDLGGAVARVFGVRMPNGMAKRVTFIIDKQGIVRHVDTQVKPATHGKDVAEALARLGMN